MPTTPFIGVRISWLMLATNWLLARADSSAASRATASWRAASTWAEMSRPLSVKICGPAASAAPPRVSPRVRLRGNAPPSRRTPNVSTCRRPRNCARHSSEGRSRPVSTRLLSLWPASPPGTAFQMCSASALALMMRLRASAVMMASATVLMTASSRS